MIHEYRIPEGLEHSATKDRLRNELSNVYYNAENNEWMATDGRIMTTICELNGGRPSLCIPMDAVKWSRKTKAPICYEEGEHMSCAGRTFRCDYPVNYAPAKKAILAENRDMSVLVNAEYLEAALAAVKPSCDSRGNKEKKDGRCSRNVYIRFASKGTEFSPLLIENDEGFISIIMPLRG